MGGYITEKHLADADVAFPGIRAFWLTLPLDKRPKTFLNLMALFLEV
jgi:hypothetical protein